MFIIVEKKTLKIVQLHGFRVRHDQIINYRFETIRRPRQWYFSGFREKVKLFPFCL